MSEEDDNDVDMNMDENMLKLIFDRIINMSYDTKNNTVSRNDLLERLFYEDDIKEFYQMIDVKDIDDFKSF